MSSWFALYPDLSGVAGLGNVSGQLVKNGTHLGVGLSQVLDFTAGVHNGSVVPAAKVAADFLQTVLCEMPGQIHTNLSRLGDTLAAFFALQVRKADIEVACHDVGNVADSYVFCGGLNLAIQRRLRHLEGDFFARRHRHGVYGRQRPFKLTYICVDLSGDVAGDIIADMQSAKVRLFLNDGNARLVAWRVNPCD